MYHMSRVELAMIVSGLCGADFPSLASDNFRAVIQCVHRIDGMSMHPRPIWCVRGIVRLACLELKGLYEFQEY